MKAQVLVSRNLRRLRVAKGLSQEVLAVDAGIDRTYVSKLERGRADPTVGMLEKLAKALSAPISAFFEENRATRNPIAPLASGRRKKTP